MPNLQRGGHASILHTFLCNLAILANQRGGPWHNGPPLNTPLKTTHMAIYTKLRQVEEFTLIAQSFSEKFNKGLESGCRTVSNNDSGSGLAPAQNILAVQVWFGFT